MYLYVLFVLACVYVCVLGNLSWDCTCVLCFWLFRLIAEVTNLKHKNYKITIVEWRNERQRIDYLLMSSEDKRLSVVGENTFLFLIVVKFYILKIFVTLIYFDDKDSVLSIERSVNISILLLLGAFKTKHFVYLLSAPR